MMLATLVANGLMRKTANDATAPRAPGSRDFLYATNTVTLPTASAVIEVARNTVETDVAITATTEATADKVVGVAGILPPNAQSRIVFNAPAWRASTSGIRITLVVYSAGSSVGLLGAAFTSTSGNDAGPLRFETGPFGASSPSGLTVSYVVRAYVSSGTGTIRGGAAGSGAYFPMQAALLAAIPWPGTTDDPNYLVTPE